MTGNIFPPEHMYRRVSNRMGRLYWAQATREQQLFRSSFPREEALRMLAFRARGSFPVGGLCPRNMLTLSIMPPVPLCIVILVQQTFFKPPHLSFNLPCSIVTGGDGKRWEDRKPYRNWEWSRAFNEIYVSIPSCMKPVSRDTWKLTSEPRKSEDQSMLEM